MFPATGILAVVLVPIKGGTGMDEDVVAVVVVFGVCCCVVSAIVGAVVMFPDDTKLALDKFSNPTPMVRDEEGVSAGD